MILSIICILLSCLLLFLKVCFDINLFPRFDSLRIALHTKDTGDHNNDNENDTCSI
jgi:hypothetical protein